MNIDDTYDDTLEAPTVNVWTDLLSKQDQLHEKYKHIEGKLGYGIMDGPYHIDKPSAQYYLKDLMWRVHEEISEALQAKESDGERHYIEELIDALHFLLELNVVVGYVYPPSPHFVHAHIMEVSFTLGLAANQLKNKPWKQDFKETDINAFFGYLGMANSQFWSVLHKDVGNSQDIWRYYMAKHDVNQFRIRSNY